MCKDAKAFLTLMEPRRHFHRSKLLPSLAKRIPFMAAIVVYERTIKAISWFPPKTSCIASITKPVPE
jgi:hypothetical protein